MSYTLDNVRYQIFIHPKQATIGTLYFCAKNIINNYKQNNKLQENTPFLNDCCEFLENVNKLYVEAIKISNKSHYINFIRKIFENDYYLGFRLPKKIYEEYHPYNYDKLQVNKLNLLKVFEILFLKLRFWQYVISNNGFNGLFDDSQMALSELLTNFLDNYTRNTSKVSKKFYKKNKDTQEVEEYYIDCNVYSEKWIEDLNLNIRNFELTK